MWTRGRNYEAIESKKKNSPLTVPLTSVCCLSCEFLRIIFHLLIMDVAIHACFALFCLFFCFFVSLLFVLSPLFFCFFVVCSVSPPSQWRRQALNAMNALQITSSIETRRPFLSKISISKPHSAIVLRRYFLQFKNLYKKFGRHVIIIYGEGKKKYQAICTLMEVLLMVCWCYHIYSVNITVTDF